MKSSIFFIIQPVIFYPLEPNLIFFEFQLDEFVPNFRGMTT